MNDDDKEFDGIEKKVEVLKARIAAGDASDAVLYETVAATLEMLGLLQKQRDQARLDAATWKARHEGLKEGIVLMKEGPLLRPPASTSEQPEDRGPDLPGDPIYLNKDK